MITDRCPGVLRLHSAADGHLARIRLPGGRLDGVGLRAVATLAAAGNGVVELTSRASLQIRGLDAGAASWAADVLWEAGLLPSPEHDRVRNILASPFGGRHPAAVLGADSIVVALDRALCGDHALAVLPGRFLFVVEDGSRTLGRQRADVSLVATGAAGRLRLDLAGRPTTLEAAAQDAPKLALNAARAFMQLRREDGSNGWRIDDLADGAARIARALGGSPREEVAPIVPRLTAAGALEQAGGRWAVTALAPLGRVERTALPGLADLLADEALQGPAASVPEGSTGPERAHLRVSPARTLTVLDVPSDRVGELTATLEGLGLVTAPNSGWEGLSACAGLHACQNARGDVRAAAVRRASVRRGSPGHSRSEHWTACERGCGRPPAVAAAVTVEADAVRIERAGATTTSATIDDALRLLAAQDSAR